MAEDTSQEKTEEPTPKRKQKAREEGNVARSRELNTSAILIVAAFSFILFGPLVVRKLVEIMHLCFGFDSRASWDLEIATGYLEVVFIEVFLSLTPIFGMLLIAALFAPISLGGWNFSTKTLMPKGSRMNPLSGIKRMFSMNSLVELLKGWAKVIVVATIAIIVLIGLKNDFLSMIFQPTENAIEHAATLISWSFLLIVSSTVLIALVDVPFQIHSHTKKLRMTMQEIKDEYKNTEGKPEVKAKVRQLQREMANRRMMKDVPEADVIITNPTHYAVALKYKPNEMPAPVMIAKGADLVAFKIKEIGEEYNIPVLQVPALARSIYHNTEIGSEIPEGLYIAVAQVLAYIYQVDQWKRGQMDRRPAQPNYPIPEDLREDE